MKVANITIDGRWGGPQKTILQVAHKLKNTHNIETIIIFPSNSDSDEFQNKLDDAKISYKRIHLTKPQKGFIKMLKFALFFFYEVVSLSFLLKKIKPDIVHCNGAWQLQGVLASILVRKNIIWCLNDTRDSFMKYIVNFSNRYIDAYCVTANQVKKIYFPRNKIENKIIYQIRPPVDTHQYNPENVKQKKDKIIIGTLGNINAFKGIELFLEIAKDVNEKKPNQFKFLLGGPIFDSQKKYGMMILNIVKNLQQTGVDIEYLGNITEPKEFYEKIDIFLCTSTSESGPMTVFEAMAMENVVIATDVGDLKEIIIENKQGFVISDRDPNKFVKKILLISQNRELLNKFGKSARNRVIETNSLKLCASKHAKMYNSLITKK